MHSKPKRMMFILLIIVILLSGCQVQKTYNLIYVIAEKDYDLLENVPLELHETLKQIDFSQSHSSTLTSKNRIFMWGDNQYTQLGDDVLEQSYIPIDITSRFSLRRNEVIS